MMPTTIPIDSHVCFISYDAVSGSKTTTSNAAYKAVQIIDNGAVIF